MEKAKPRVVKSVRLTADEQVRRYKEDARRDKLGPARLNRLELCRLFEEAMGQWQEEFRKQWTGFHLARIKTTENISAAYRLKFSAAYFLGISAATKRYAELLAEAVAWRCGLKGDAFTWVEEELRRLSFELLHRMPGVFVRECAELGKSKKREALLIMQLLGRKKLGRELGDIHDRILALGLPPRPATKALELVQVLRGSAKALHDDVPRIRSLPSRNDEPSFSEKRAAEILGKRSTRQIRYYVQHGALTRVGHGYIVNDVKFAALWESLTKG